MKLTYNNIDNKDINREICPDIDEGHLETHKLDKEDIKKLDRFYNMICEIIDDCDSILIQFDEELIKKYMKNLKYECYEYIEGLNLGSITDNYIFDISDSKSKEYLKNNIEFDIYQYDDEHVELYPEIDRKYLYKEKNTYIGSIAFIKKNKILYRLHRFYGSLVCFESFKNRKYKNISKLDIISNRNAITHKKIFIYNDIINNNIKLKNYLKKLFEDIDLSNLIIENYDGELLKNKNNYGYFDLYINNKLKNKTIFNINISCEEDEYLLKIYEVILKDIKENKNNTYYFNKFYKLKEFLCVALYLKDGKVEEVRNEEAIKQFTKKK